MWTVWAKGLVRRTPGGIRLGELTCVGHPALEPQHSNVVGVVIRLVESVLEGHAHVILLGGIHTHVALTVLRVVSVVFAQSNRSTGRKSHSVIIKYFLRLTGTLTVERRP